ncbi:MAG TPA: phosphodiester glycosidase family protein, partial [bacterium]|nr:phosphodiester glycosidase family protein [bacterium]
GLARRVLREGQPLVACINGDYFDQIDDGTIFPWGILVLNGELAYSPSRRSALYVGADGKAGIDVFTLRATLSPAEGGGSLPVEGVNQPPSAAGSAYLYTPRWGASTPEFSRGQALVFSGAPPRCGADSDLTVVGRLRMPVRVPIPPDGCVLVVPGKQEALAGFELGSRAVLAVASPSGIVWALGGGPRLVREGRISFEHAREGFVSGQGAYMVLGRHPRSAVGVSADGSKLLLVAVEGRTEASEGMKLDEFAALLQALGAADAMSFDGGRSVGLWAGGEDLVTGGREVCDALAVVETGEGRPAPTGTKGIADPVKIE